MQKGLRSFEKQQCLNQAFIICTTLHWISIFREKES